MSEFRFKKQESGTGMRNTGSLRKTSRESPNLEPETKLQPLSEVVLGYQHPEADAIRAAAEATYLDSERTFGIPGSRGHSELGEESMSNVVAEMKEQVHGGVFLNCGYGDALNTGLARDLDIKSIIGIEVQKKGIGEIGEFREEQIGDDVRILEIREDITVALSQMQTASVDVVYYSALDVFRGDLELFFRELDRVLKPGGYLIDDGQSNLVERPKWEGVSQDFDAVRESWLTKVLKKRVQE